jgi:hypothetical protein
MRFECFPGIIADQLLRVMENIYFGNGAITWRAFRKTTSPLVEKETSFPNS